MSSSAFYLMIRILLCRLAGCRKCNYVRHRNVRTGCEYALDAAGNPLRHPVYQLHADHYQYCSRCGLVVRNGQ